MDGKVRDFLVWLKIMACLIVMVWGLNNAWHFETIYLTKGFDLAIHEFGHLFFGWGGEFLQLLGGTLMQLGVPAGICGYFFFTRQKLSGAVTLFWLGQNFIDIAIYIRDARSQTLPLVGGGTHDWHYLLGSLHLLEQDQTIAGIVWLIGVILTIAFAILGGHFAWQERSAGQVTTAAGVESRPSGRGPSPRM